MIVTTTHSVEGQRITRCCGIAAGGAIPGASGCCAIYLEGSVG